MAKMPITKRTFPMDLVHKTKMDERPTIALEFIAYYLDRIDDHLERLAVTLEATGGGFPMLKAELEGIRKVLDQKK